MVSSGETEPWQVHQKDETYHHNILGDHRGLFGLWREIAEPFCPHPHSVVSAGEGRLPASGFQDSA